MLKNTQTPTKHLTFALTNSIFARLREIPSKILQYKFVESKVLCCALLFLHINTEKLANRRPVC